MLQSKSFLKKTRRGTVLKVVREHYLRDDISCGALFCTHEICSKKPALDSACLVNSLPHILLIDTDVALHQIDFLENEAIKNVVVLSIVLEEVKHKNLSAYNRLRSLCSNKERKFYVFANEHHRETYIPTNPGESPNDRNDRAIRTATKWYSKHLGPNPAVLLLTNDRENIKKAEEEGISAMTVQSYVKSQNLLELLDVVSTGTSEDQQENDDDSHQEPPSKKTLIYPEHLPLSELTRQLSQGLLQTGKLRMSRSGPFVGQVASLSIQQPILIKGRLNLNRAVEGDIVAVELLPGREGAGDQSGDPGEEEEEEEKVGLAPTVSDEVPIAVPEEEENEGMEPDQSYVATSSRPAGKVVGIIKRNWRQYCGSFSPPNGPLQSSGRSQSALFVCFNPSIPKIRVQTRQLAALLTKRVVVAIDSWDRSSLYPSGHYVRTIGDIGDKATESEVLLIENDINTRPFSESVLACLPPLPWSFSNDMLTGGGSSRMDLRHVSCFSVDPPGCRDIDDALHCSPLPNGNFNVGVHIADVTNFVVPGSALDEEASKRGTSVYLVEKRIDMLPKPLTEDICSLRADVDRMAFSVLWEMTTSAEVVSVKFTKSVIRSRAALSYAEAQIRMDDSRLADEVTRDLRNLNSLAKVMRKRRIEKGALTLASPEVKFVIDTETLDPLDVGMYQVREANQMVEEFMLAANIAVAEKIVSHFPTISLLRRHPIPTPKMLEPLLQTAAAVGVNLDISSSKALADSLDLAVTDDPLFNKLIRILATRCMTQAVYFPSGELSVAEFHHYGLATPIYTHFTSPIRRYADVVVHRLLSAALGLNPIPPQMRDKKGLNSLTDNLNYRHRNAQMAGRASVELYTLVYFKQRPTNEEARIVGVRSNGMMVFVPKFGIEGPVFLIPKENKSGPRKGATEPVEGNWVMDEEKKLVSSKDGKLKYKVLDKVTVCIQVIEPQPNRPKLSLTLLLNS